MNVRCEGTIVLYHRNSIRGDTVGVFHMWLAISRSYRHDLNGIAQLIYAIPTAILTPFLLWLLLHHLQLSFESIFAIEAIVGLVQWLGTEIYFRKNLKG